MMPPQKNYDHDTHNVFVFLHYKVPWTNQKNKELIEILFAVLFFAEDYSSCLLIVMFRMAIIF